MAGGIVVIPDSIVGFVSPFRQNDPPAFALDDWVRLAKMTGLVSKACWVRLAKKLPLALSVKRWESQIARRERVAPRVQCRTIRPDRITCTSDRIARCSTLITVCSRSV